MPKSFSKNLSVINCVASVSYTQLTRSIGPVTINEVNFDAHEIYNNSLYMPDADAALKASGYLEE